MNNSEVISELIESLIKKNVVAVMNDKSFEAIRGKQIFGLDGLANFLGCSRVTAFKISKSGVFKRYKVPGTRQIFFFEN